jgi:hypothetical protein
MRWPLLSKPVGLALLRYRSMNAKEAGVKMLLVFAVPPFLGALRVVFFAMCGSV